MRTTTRHTRRLLLTAAVVATAGLAGCAYQDPLSLPPLGSAGSGGYAPSPYYGYGGGYYDPRYRSYDPRFGLYSSYGYDPLRYYDPRLGYYAGGYPGYYGPLPYPAPGYYPYPRGPYCVDANRDGRCDRRNDGDGDGDGHGGNGHHGNGNGNGQGSGGGQGPGFDPKKDPFGQVREMTRRAERTATAPAAPATMSPGAAGQPQRPAEPKRSTEPRRAPESKRASSAPPSGWKSLGDDAAAPRTRGAPRDDAGRRPPDPE